MKKILYTQRVEVIESYHERRDCADQNIPRFIRACGYLPIPVPNLPELLGDYFEEIKPDGVILTGGNSLIKHGGNAKEKDELDHMIIEYAIKKSIPIYGFCRGMQSILDYFENEQLQVAGHVAVRHEINGEIGKFVVNSYHNQGVKDVKSPLIVTARGDDGVVEAVKHTSKRIIGTMWHPEREIPFSTKDIERIQRLFD